jgi:hypothetical protein
MLKTVDHQVLTTWLDEHAAEAVTGIYESLSELHDDHVTINDFTPDSDLAVLTDSPNPVVNLLARERHFNARNLTDDAIMEPFVDLCIKYQNERGEKLDFGRYPGKCYAWGELYEALGETEKGICMKKWGLIRANL